jgi:hypothetical protein
MVLTPEPKVRGFNWASKPASKPSEAVALKEITEEPTAETDVYEFNPDGFLEKNFLSIY